MNKRHSHTSFIKTLQDVHTKYEQRPEEFTSEIENPSNLEKTIKFRN